MLFRSDLKNKYPLSKEFLVDFIEKHPGVLKKYKDSLPDKARPLAAAEIEGQQVAPRLLDHTALIDQLEKIPPGKKDAGTYQNFVLTAATEIFYPALDRPSKEQRLDDGRKRVDIYFNNAAESGFFSRLVNRHNIRAPYIAIECKNYDDDIANPDLDQLTARFSRKRGRFGILFCRKVRNQQLLLKRLQDVVNNSTELSAVIVLEDEDVKRLIKLRSEGKSREIDEYLEEKLRPILL